MDTREGPETSSTGQIRWFEATIIGVPKFISGQETVVQLDKRMPIEGHVHGGADYVTSMMGGRRKMAEAAQELPLTRKDSYDSIVGQMPLTEFSIVSTYRWKAVNFTSLKDLLVDSPRQDFVLRMFAVQILCFPGLFVLIGDDFCEEAFLHIILVILPEHRRQYGKEATIIGSAAVLAPDDEVLGEHTHFASLLRGTLKLGIGHYHKMSVLLWRGFGIDGIMAGYFGNLEDKSACRIPGILLPHDLVTSSNSDPVHRHKTVACIYFGEGAASERGFHVGMLLASTISCPTIYLARNDGIAVSTMNNTPATVSPHGGLDNEANTVCVGGNDILAVMNAVTEARKRYLTSGPGCLGGGNDPSRWAPLDDCLWSRGAGGMIRSKTLKPWRKGVLTALRKAEYLKQSGLRDLFTDVYAVILVVGATESWD
ncbi:hypothetical protein EV401DRAFT_1893761 [Pisolithus croceorrhizus]|nr:hypothetical protein EV401DRAFT_1893761 [Pisolithus croceorrhizus]